MSMFICYDNSSAWQDENTQEEAKLIEAFIKVESRWKQAKERLEEAKYLEKLIFSDYINTIRSSKTIWDYYRPTIEKAREEIDKKKKKERENISFLERAIKATFFKNIDCNIRISRIVSGGYEGYYWDLAFSVRDVEYIIQIPMRQALTVNNFEYAHKGKFVFLERTSSCSTHVLFDDWAESGLAEKIEKYFDSTEAV